MLWNGAAGETVGPSVDRLWGIDLCLDGGISWCCCACEAGLEMPKEVLVTSSTGLSASSETARVGHMSCCCLGMAEPADA